MPTTTTPPTTTPPHALPTVPPTPDLLRQIAESLRHDAVLAAKKTSNKFEAQFRAGCQLGFNLASQRVLRVLAHHWPDEKLPELSQLEPLPVEP